MAVSICSVRNTSIFITSRVLLAGSVGLNSMFSLGHLRNYPHKNSIQGRKFFTFKLEKTYSTSETSKIEALGCGYKVNLGVKISVENLKVVNSSRIEYLSEALIKFSINDC